MTGKLRFMLLFLFLCFIVLCSGESIAGAAAQDKDTFRMRVDVDVVTVEVTAVDKNERPARNLKIEDFQLYEDGKLQDILSLDEVNAESGTSALGASPIGGNALLHGKSVLIIFDDGDIAPENLKISRDTAERFVREHMRPQDLFAVAAFRMGMKLLQNFTRDREEVLAAVRQPAGPSAGGPLYFEELLRSLGKIFQLIAPIKGQKSILIYSQWAPEQSLAIQKTYLKTLTAAKKSNAVVYLVNPQMLHSSTGDISNSTMGPILDFGWDVVGRLGANSSVGSLATMEALARESGGYSIYNTNDYNGELDEFDRRISNYYILGFESNNPKHDGAFRKLEIKTKAKGVNLKYRPGYQDRHPVDVLAGSKQEKTLLTALASPNKATQLPITFRPLYFYDPPQAARVLIAVRLQTDKIAFKKKGGQIGADLNIMGVAYAEDGSVAARFSETLPLALDQEKNAESRKGALRYLNYFKLHPGKYRLKLAASDESNNLGATEQSLEVPALPGQGFAVSSLVVAEQLSQLPDLIKNLQSQLLDQSNPLLFLKTQIEPSVENRLPANSVILALFRIYSVLRGTDQLELAAAAALLNAKGEKIAILPIPLKETMFSVSPSEAVVGLRLPFPNVPPGKYRLMIEIAEKGSGQSATLQTDIEYVQ
jgi:VWFA-related protein